MPRYDFEDKLKTLKSISPHLNDLVNDNNKDIVACSEVADEKEDETKDSPVEFNFSQNKLNERLFRAVKTNDIEAVKQALNDGANVNVKCEYGKTPLHWAALYGYTETAKILIEKGADVNARDENGYTPLHHADGYGNEETAALLKQHGGVA